MDPEGLRCAVEHDSVESGEPLLPTRDAVELTVEKLNALRVGELH